MDEIPEIEESLMRSLARSLTLCAIMLALLLAAVITGCSGGNSSIGLVSPVPDGGRVVTENVTDIEEWDAVMALAPGTIVQVRLNRNQFEVREYEAVLQNVDNTFGEHIAVCKMKTVIIDGRDVTPVVGEGDSGSPVLHNGKTIAALCYGLAAGDNLTFGARSIRDEIALSGDISVKSRSLSNPRFRPLGLVKFDSIKSRQQVLKLSGSRSAAGLKIIAGMSIAVCEMNGVATIGAIGTISYISGSTIYAFGHAYNLNGDNATPVVLASMSSMGNGGAAGASKLAIPTDIKVGTMTRDTYTGIKIETAAVAKTYPVTIKCKVDGEQKNDVVEDTTSHNWQLVGQGWFAMSEGDLIYALSGWVLSRQTGIIIAGTSTGTFCVKYPGSAEIKENFSLPIANSMYASTDIASETANQIGKLLAKYEQKWMSPEYVVIETSITRGVQSGKVYAEIIDKDGNAVTADDQKVYHVAMGDYQVKAWVPGWTKYKVTLDSPGELNPLTIISGGFTAAAPGTATVSVTVTNLLTNEQKILDLALDVQIDGNLPPPGAG